MYRLVMTILLDSVSITISITRIKQPAHSSIISKKQRKERYEIDEPLIQGQSGEQSKLDWLCFARRLILACHVQVAELLRRALLGDGSAPTRCISVTSNNSHCTAISQRFPEEDCEVDRTLELRRAS